MVEKDGNGKEERNIDLFQKAGNKKLGVHEGWKNGKPKCPITPTRTVLFLDNTVGGELARRFQKAEEEAGLVSGYRVRITESAGTALSMLLPSTNPLGPQDCERLDCVTCHQGELIAERGTSYMRVSLSLRLLEHSRTL